MRENMRHKIITTPTTNAQNYEIRLKGHLDARWVNQFGGLMTITLEEDGDTLLTGPVADQAALHGLLKKVRDLGMTLVSVVQVQFSETRSYRSEKEIEMSANTSTTKIDPKVKLSLLWIFVVLNIAYADILSLMDSTSAIRKVMGGAPLPAGGLIAGAILMETAIAMVILSWLLNYKVNRWVNIIIGALNILAVVTGGHGPYYVFFATVEVACMLLIIWFAWKWKPDVTPNII
jgi:hypothetical protein